MARSCSVWASQGDGCTCHNSAGNVIEYNPTADVYSSTHPTQSIYTQCCISGGVGGGCAAGIASGGSTMAMGLQPAMGSGTIVRPTKPTLTGQPVKWRKQSGDSGGKFLGLSTTQLLIAGAVGVGAYLLMKKKK